MAMINIVICARICPLDCIGSPFFSVLSRKTRSYHVAIITSRRINSRPKGPIIVTWSVGELRPSYAPAGLCCGRNFRIRFSKSRSRGPDDPRFRDKARRWDSLSIYGYAVGGRLRSRVSFGYTRHLDAKGGGPSMWARWRVSRLQRSG